MQRENPNHILLLCLDALDVKTQDRKKKTRQTIFYSTAKIFIHCVTIFINRI